MATPDSTYPKSSTTDQTASGPTGNASDVTPTGTPKSDDNGVAPPVNPQAAANASQVMPHQTSCVGDSVLESTIANGLNMHNTGSSSGSKRYE